jgi:peptide/nickel transport system substrate-binding protein
MTYFLDQEPASWNNLNADANLFDLGQINDRVWPSVFHVDPTFKLFLDKDLMISADQTSASPQTITYKINPKAVWADGTPINAADFIYNWQTQNGDPSQKDVDGKPFNPASTTGYSQIQSVTGSTDGFTVTVVFKTPFPDWQSLFSTMAPAHIAKTVGWNSGFKTPQSLMSGGPFMISAYTQGSSLTVVRNPKYWGTPTNLASITYRFLTDSSTVEPAYANGEINAGFPTPQLDLVNQLKQISNITLDLRSGLEFEHLDFNQSNKFLKDDVLRHAIMLSIDRPGLIARTVGQFAPSVKPLNNRMYVSNQPQYKDTSGGEFDAANPTQAKSILTAAGYTFASDGSLMTKAGEKVTLRITSTQGNALRSNEEQFVASELKSAIGVTVNEVDTSKLGSTLSSGSFDMIIFAWVSTPFASGNDAIYQCPNTSTGAGGSNYDNYCDPAMDALIKSADNELDQTTRTADYNQMDTLAWKDHVTLPLFQRPTLLAFDQKFVNMYNDASSEGPVYNQELWGVKVSAS